MATTNRLKTATAAPSRTIASYSTYAEAERAVDWLADGFAVERSAIVGTGSRLVEQVTGPMTPGRAYEVALPAAGCVLGEAAVQRTEPSAPSIQADRYDVQVDEEAADPAMRILGGMTEAR